MYHYDIYLAMTWPVKNQTATYTVGIVKPEDKDGIRVLVCLGTATFPGLK